MSKMSNAGEGHCQALFVARLDGIAVAHGAAGLDNRRDSRTCGFLNIVAEGEEGIGGQNRTFASLTRFAHRDLYRIDAAHLSGPNTNNHAIFAKHNGVALDVLAHQPGEAQIAHFLLARPAFGHDFELSEIVTTDIAVLHQQTTIDAAIISFGTDRRDAGPTDRRDAGPTDRRDAGPTGFERAGFQQTDALFPGRPRREHVESGLTESGSDDALNEAIRLADLHRCRLIDFAIETKDAAESAERIALVRLAERLDERAGDCRAAGIVMLDDDRCRLREFADEIQCTIKIEQVVIRQLLSVQHLGACYAVRRSIRLNIEGGTLVRILAVAQGLPAPQMEIE